MKAAVLPSAGRVEIEDLPRPHAGLGEIVVKVGACGLCGTDQHIFEGSGHLTVDFPLVPGHELAGEIVETGENAGWLKPGDRVALDPNIHCGHCFYCHRGEVHLCENLQALGVTRNGGFEEYCLSPARQAILLPENVTTLMGGLAEPVACCLHGADRLAVTPGETVLILGGGFIGLVLLQLMKAAGAGAVIVSEPFAPRRQKALELGAARAVDPNADDLAAIVMEATEGRGADACIEAAGRVQTAEQAVHLARRGGRILFFGVVPEGRMAQVAPFDVYRKVLSILGSFVNPFSHARAVQLLSDGVVKVEGLVSHRFPVEDFAEALEAARRPDAVKVVVTP
jgi:2-desacetyl-2-hydroxyethyl bacteriochlorophyllide A dehydrogenase